MKPVSMFACWDRGIWMLILYNYWPGSGCLMLHIRRDLLKLLRGSCLFPRSWYPLAMAHGIARCESGMGIAHAGNHHVKSLVALHRPRQPVLSPHPWCVQASALFGSELWWTYGRGVNGQANDIQLMVNRQARSTTGCYKSTNTGALVAEAGLGTSSLHNSVTLPPLTALRMRCSQLC